MIMENIIHCLWVFACMYKRLNNHVSLDNINVYYLMLRDYMMIFDGFIHFNDEVMKQNMIKLLIAMIDSSKFIYFSFVRLHFYLPDIDLK